MRVALFGGTFDPIHNGHLNAAREVLKQGLVKEVWFIPVYWHAFKENKKVTALSHRKKMIELSLKGEQAMQLLDLNENPTYTIDTILKVKALFPKNEYLWLMGTNLIEEFSSWRDSHRVLNEAKLLLYPVPGSEREHNKLIGPNNSVVVNGPAIDLSSTVVRERLSKGKTVAGLLPNAVLQYIKENNLY